MAQPVLAGPVDGSLLYIENGNRVVQQHTDSTVTHVAIILIENDVPIVYEATPPRVRKIALSEYYREIDKINTHKRTKLKVWISDPKTPITAAQHDQMKQYLEKQIGRKYSISSYVNQRPGKGIHCCELVGQALERIGITYTDNACADDPWGVWIKTKPYYGPKESTR